MSFAVGQRVICIDDSAPRVASSVIGRPLALGALFTVRARVFSPEGRPNVQLVENEIRHPGWPGECWWSASRFRAIDDLTTTEAACESTRIPQTTPG